MPAPTRYHHVAFGTKDIDKTYDFYANRLGLPLSHCESHLSGKGWFKHFFFDIGNGEQLGFFAFENVGEKDGYRTDISTGLGLPPWVNHVAFNMASMEDLETMKGRAEQNGVELAMEVDHGWCHSIYFVDPNGIMVEFTTDTDTAAFTQSVEEALRVLRQDPREISAAHRKDESTGVSVKR
jgi:glyoxylase I family protein